MKKKIRFPVSTNRATLNSEPIQQLRTPFHLACSASKPDEVETDAFDASLPCAVIENALELKAVFLDASVPQHSQGIVYRENNGQDVLIDALSRTASPGIPAIEAGSCYVNTGAVTNKVTRNGAKIEVTDDIRTEVVRRLEIDCKQFALTIPRGLSIDRLSCPLQVAQVFEQSFVHRDLKPSNIMNDSNTLKLIDLELHGLDISGGRKQSHTWLERENMTADSGKQPTFYYGAKNCDYTSLEQMRVVEMSEFQSGHIDRKCDRDPIFCDDPALYCPLCFLHFTCGCREMDNQSDSTEDSNHGKPSETMSVCESETAQIVCHEIFGTSPDCPAILTLQDSFDLLHAEVQRCIDL